METANDEVSQYLQLCNVLEKTLEWANKHCLWIINAVFKRAWIFKTSSSKVPIGRDGGVTVLFIGNSRIDATWLWRKQDTLTKKIPVTFTRALHHMDVHPQFTYAQNQAVYYKWVKENYPKLYDFIKRRVAEGRWNYAGGIGSSLTQTYLWGNPSCGSASTGSGLVRHFRRIFSRDCAGARQFLWKWRRGHNPTSMDILEQLAWTRKGHVTLGSTKLL